MNGEPTQRELYDAIRNLQGAMLHRFNTLDGRMTVLETRFHEFDEDLLGFRVEVNRRFDHIDRQFAEIHSRLA
ncbi:MAG TPA: hypothetical protein VK760_07320 [Candidatus Acidoferrales bacterium]|jgi:hypothetical protein|nr:hypothetical protein [Candidatus Acidoferrales bacterium]